MGFFFSKIIRNLVFLYVLFSGAQYLLKWKSYAFSPKEFRNSATKAQGSAAGNGGSAANLLAHDLTRAYGPLIVPDPKWVAMSAGGLDLRVQLLHSTLTEFIAVINAPFSTQGRSGLHWTNNTCTVLSGTVERSADTLNIANKEVFKSGGNFRHGQFESHIYKFADDTFVVCYGRGLVPLSSVWPLMGSISIGDPVLFAKQVYYFGEAWLHTTLHALHTTFDYYKKKALKSEL